MKTLPALYPRALIIAAALYFAASNARAETIVFFDASQSTNITTWTDTSETVGTEGYLFTVTRDKLFTGGVGMTNPIGRTVRIPWPAGMEAQAVTTGPALSGARMQIQREDGALFSIQSFTARLLANTAGAGASIEIMPLLNGEDGAPDPFMYNATGYYWSVFHYMTPELTGFDTYKIGLYVDFALMQLTLVDASPRRPSLEVAVVTPGLIQLSWPTNSAGYILEVTTNLPAQAWQRVTNAAAIDDEIFRLTLPCSSTNQFYRLRR